MRYSLTLAAVGLLAVIGCEKPAEQNVQQAIVDEAPALPSAPSPAPIGLPGSAGQSVRAPKIDQPAAIPLPPPPPPPPPPAPERTYTIKAGDTLWRIATEQLGDGKRFKDIVAANPGLDANRLKIGQVIRLPQN